MKIACPACSAAYDVPSDRLRPGRTVKCARCGGTWTPVDALPVLPHAETVPPAAEPLADQADALPSAPPAVAPTTAEPAPALPSPALPPAVPPASSPVAPGRRPVLASAWLLSAVLLVAVAYGAVAGRAGIMRAWPPSGRVYAALGLAG